MKRLYNEYSALNPEGDELFNNILRGILPLVRELDQKDVDLRDARSVAWDAIGIAFAEAIHNRAARLLASQKAPAYIQTPKTVAEIVKQAGT